MFHIFVDLLFIYLFTNSCGLLFSINSDMLETGNSQASLKVKRGKSFNLTEFEEIEKKQLDFTFAEKMRFVELHNIYRSNVTPPAANMAFMEWDDELAILAQKWADVCIFAHFIPDNTYPGTIGQNLYKGNFPDAEEAMFLFYDERRFYDYRTQECNATHGCGHYTQVVWEESVKVGCARAACYNGQPSYHIGCHYSPAGNIGDNKPYIVGQPCSLCSKGSLCFQNMCITPEQCKKYPTICAHARCERKCQNCGLLDTEKCECKCVDGWDSADCSAPCENIHEMCGNKQLWPDVNSCSLGNYVVGDIYCRKMCKRCETIDPEDKFEDLCCGGSLCPDGYVLDVQGDCTCHLLCPGPECYIAYEENTTYSNVG